MDNPGGAGYLPHECETAGLPTGSRAQRHFAFLSLPQPWLRFHYTRGARKKKALLTGPCGRAIYERLNQAMASS